MISFRSLVSVCGNLGVAAGDILRFVHEKRKAGESLEIVDKGKDKQSGFDPQTIADRNSEKLIVNGLRTIFGSELIIVGEESGLAPKRDEEDEQDDDNDDSTIFSKEFTLESIQNSLKRIQLNWWPESEDVLLDMKSVSVWIDPLDATREYTEGNVEFCTVLIGIAINGRSTAGIMIEPFANTDGPICWWGCKDIGCYRTIVNTNHSSRVQFEKTTSFSSTSTTSPNELISLQPTTKKNVRITVSRSRKGGLVEAFTSRYIQILEQESIDYSLTFCGGCGYKILMILKNLADFYPFPCSGTSMWDSCAGDALLDAAGGLLTDKNGNRLIFDPTATNFLNFNGLLASNDEQICKFTSSNIASCLESLRNLNFEFIGTKYLNDIFKKEQEEVNYFLTPKESFKKSTGETSFDILINGGRKIIQYRKFDASICLKQDIVPNDIVLYTLMKNSQRAFFLKEIYPVMMTQTNILFNNKILMVETCKDRRPPTLNEIDKKNNAFTPLFLQSISYVELSEQQQEQKNDSLFVDQIRFLKQFHDFFRNNEELKEKYRLQGWGNIQNMLNICFASIQKEVNLSLYERVNKLDYFTSSSSSFSITRGIWQDEPSSMIDIHLSGSNHDELEDLAYLFISTSTTLSHAINVLQTFKKYYFTNEDESHMITKLKYSLFNHLKRFLFRKTYQEILRTKGRLDNAFLVMDILCKELEEFGELNSTRLNCFDIQSSSSKL